MSGRANVSRSTDLRNLGIALGMEGGSITLWPADSAAAAPPYVVAWAGRNGGEPSGIQGVTKGELDTLIKGFMDGGKGRS